MKSILRSLLVCFLLLALPFQAFASASMRPLAERQAAAMQAAQLPPCHQQAASADGMRHDHAVRHDKQNKHDPRKCGTCAACCTGAAMAPGLAASLALAPPQFVSVPFRAGYLPSVDPVLPERPPRALLG